MNFDYTPKVKDMQARLLAFMDEHIYPQEHRYHEEVAANLEYAPLCEIMGRVHWAP